MYQRIFIVILPLLLLVSLTFFRAVVEGSYYFEKSVSFLTKKINIPVKRGLILDRNGLIIADSVLTYRISFYSGEKFKVFHDKVNINNLNNFFVFNEELYFVETDNKDIAKLSTNEFIEGEDFYLEEFFKRKYMSPEIFSNITGYVVSDSLQKTQGFYKGQSQLEKMYNEELSGTNHYTLIYDNETTYFPGVDGKNIELTIDFKWQEFLYNKIKDYSLNSGALIGASVVIDSENGELLSLVSYPGYDTNWFLEGITNEQSDFLNSNKSSPLINHAYQSSFTPGSIFKLFTSHLLLDAGVVSSDTLFNSLGCIYLNEYQFCEYNKNVYGIIDLRSAISKSSNLYFCNFITKMNDIDILNTKSLEWSLGYPLGIDLYDEERGLVDSRDYRRITYGESWFEGDDCNFSIGQGMTLLTPLQASNMASIIRNKGFYFVPRVVLDSKQAKVKNVTSENREYFVDIQKGMADAAYGNSSILKNFFSGLLNNEVQVKTGSAETTKGGVHSWVVGSFKFNGKFYSISIFVENGGGGYNVVHIFSDFLSFLESSVK